jgi:hypothetical protein
MKIAILSGLVCVAVGIGGIVAVSIYQTREVRTVSWYLDNPREMMAKITACRDNPGVGRNDPECSNSEDAKYKADIHAAIAANPYK